MLKMGLPLDAVKHSMQRDGKDPRILDLDHNKSVKSQLEGDSEDDGPPLKDDPEYSKVSHYGGCVCVCWFGLQVPTAFCMYSTLKCSKWDFRGMLSSTH